MLHKYGHENVSRSLHKMSKKYYRYKIVVRKQNIYNNLFEFKKKPFIFDKKKRAMHKIMRTSRILEIKFN